MVLTTGCDANGKTLYYIDGRQVTCDEYQQALRSMPSRLSDLLSLRQPPMLGYGRSNWPMRSVALAVHPKQVAKANRRNKRLGLASYYEKDGTCIIPTPIERSKLIKAEGMVDMS